MHRELCSRKSLAKMVETGGNPAQHHENDCEADAVNFAGIIGTLQPAHVNWSMPSDSMFGETDCRAYADTELLPFHLIAVVFRPNAPAFIGGSEIAKPEKLAMSRRVTA